MIDYQKILSVIREEIEPYLSQGKVANYIPALAKVNPNQFAMSITFFDSTIYDIGNYDTKFSIQSISKVFTFTKALSIHNSKLYERVGKEPSGNPFNSLVQLEYEKGKPRNPFINAGAIVITDTLISHYANSNNTFENILSFIRNTANNHEITFDEEVCHSEYEHGFRNLALANLMKSFGNIHNCVEDVTKTYFKHCSITMTTKELSRAMLFFGKPWNRPNHKSNFYNTQASKKNQCSYAYMWSL